MRNRYDPRPRHTLRRANFVLLLAGIAAWTPAYAQDAQPVAGPAATPADAALSDIVVSARKRNETTRDVPVAITVFNAAALEKLNATNIESTLGVTPGLYVGGNFLSPSRDYRQLIIRGVGANSPLEPSVATFIDGVYSPALDFDSEFLDIERIEVLKGPQGALFGRNTEGGALNIVTRAPSLTTTHAQAQFLYDGFNTAQLSAQVSGPIVTDKLAGSVSILVRHSDTFFHQEGANVLTPNSHFPGQDLYQEYNAGHTSTAAADGERQITARGKLRFAPTDTFDATLSANYSLWKGQDQAPGPLVSCHCYTIDGDQAFQNTSKNYGAALTMNQHFGWSTLTVIAGYQKAISSAPHDFDGTNTRVGNYEDYDRAQSSSSLEIRLASDGTSRLKWLAGVYGFIDKSFTDRFYTFNDVGSTSIYNGLWNQQLTDIKRHGVAGFGQVSYDIVDGLEIAAGARYSWERAKVAALERFEFPADGLLGYVSSLDYGWSDLVTPTRRHGSRTNISPQGSIRYKITPEVSVYTSVAKGFKAGSFQTAPVSPSDVTPIKPEKTTNFEVGVKGNFFGRLLSVDADLFYVKIKDQQLSAVIFTDGSDFPSTTITNASKSHAKGFEVSATLRPTHRFQLNGNVAYVDTKFEKYSVFPGDDRNGDGVVNAADVYDRSGQSFPSTPKWTYNLSATYTLPLPGSELVFDTAYRHIGKTYVGSDSTSVDPIIPVPHWNRLDLSASWIKGRWTTKFFVENLTNNYIVLSRFNSFYIEPLGDYVHNRVAPPRRIGGSVTYKL
jgi:iron complex outermembrane recepter protein